VTRGDLTQVVHLDSTHDVSAFDCGIPELDGWLAGRAQKNEVRRGSRTYVVCTGNVVVAYYCLANGSIDRASAPTSMQRNMLDPIPVMTLGRLAVDHR